jgi:hypothetical protein
MVTVVGLHNSEYNTTNTMGSIYFVEGIKIDGCLQVVSQRVERTNEQGIFFAALRNVADQFDEAFRRLAD